MFAPSDGLLAVYIGRRLKGLKNARVDPGDMERVTGHPPPPHFELTHKKI